MINKLDILLKQPQKIYHTNDLRILWNITKLTTLYQTISRLIKKGVLIKIHKGLYCTIPITNLDPIELGSRLINRFCYLTTETILAQSGTINQSPNKITFVSDISKKITVGNNTYLYRQLNDKYLYNSIGINLQPNGVLVASTARAAADVLYFQPNYHFDNNSIIIQKGVYDSQP
ncbi:type IV toxin-antitoxin system AbiEi family antitoxin domain-containing protein [Candidatus Shapirobacteria bacterium]|nr:type IV toxin-antitoxin system AbiEi family antitoxin domain-containing protein [Candidatus Shapirobacteria bacterium]